MKITMKRALAFLLTMLLVVNVIPASAPADTYIQERAPLNLGSGPEQGDLIYNINARDSLKISAILNGLGVTDALEACGRSPDYPTLYDGYWRLLDPSGTSIAEDYFYLGDYAGYSYDGTVTDLDTIEYGQKGRLMLYLWGSNKAGWVTYGNGKNYIELYQNVKPYDHTYRLLLSDLGLTKKDGTPVEVSNVATVTYINRTTGNSIVTATQVSGEVNYTSYNGADGADEFTRTVEGTDYLLGSREPFTAGEQIILTFNDGSIERCNIPEYTYTATATEFTLQDVYRQIGLAEDHHGLVLDSSDPKKIKVVMGANVGQQDYEEKTTITLDHPAFPAYFQMRDITTGRCFYINIVDGGIPEQKIYKDEQFLYRLNEDGETLTIQALSPDYAGSGTIVIRSVSGDIEGETYPVTAVGDSAFRGQNGITTAVFENTGAMAVEGKAFQSMSNLETVEINGTGPVNFGSSHWDNVFGYCTALTTVTGTGTAGFNTMGMFQGCSSLETVSVSHITLISQNTFIDNKHALTVEADRIDRINYQGFNRCALTLLHAAAGSPVIDDNAICDNEEDLVFQLDAGLGRMYGGAFSFKDGKTLTYKADNSAAINICAYAFNWCEALAGVEITGSATMEGHAFNECAGLKTFRVDGNLEGIPTSGFYHCNNLNTVQIGGNVGTIVNYAFDGCGSLEKLIILGRTGTMETGAVRSTAIRVAVFKGGFDKLNSYAFYDDGFTQDNNLIYVGGSIPRNGLTRYSFGWAKNTGIAYFNMTYDQLKSALGGSSPYDLYLDTVRYSDQDAGAEIYVQEGAPYGYGGSASDPMESYYAALYSIYNRSNSRNRFRRDCQAAGVSDLNLEFYGDLGPGFNGFTLHVLPARGTTEASIPEDMYGDWVDKSGISDAPATCESIRTVIFENSAATIHIADGAFRKFPSLETVEVKNADAVVNIGKDAFAGTKTDTICAAEQHVTSDAGTVTLAKGADAPIGTALVMANDTGSSDSEILAAARSEGLFEGIADENIRFKYFDLSLVSPQGEAVNRPAHVSITQKSGLYSGVDTVAPSLFAFFHLNNGTPELATADFTADTAENTISYEFDADGFSPYAAAYVADVKTVSDGIYTYAVDKDGNATITGYDTGFTGSALDIPDETIIDGETYRVIGINDGALGNPPAGITITSVSFSNSGTVTVGSSAFAGLTKIDSVSFNGTGEVKFKDDSAFDGSGAGTVAVSMPNGLTAKTADGRYGAVFSGLAGEYSLTLDNIDSIPAGAFKNDVKLAEVTVQSALKNPAPFKPSWSNPQRSDYADCAIGTGAFEGASNLRTFTVEGESGESIAIGNEAFRDCESLYSLDIADKICGIGEHGLSHTGFTSLTLRVEKLGIGEEALAYCPGLKDVEFIGDVYNGGENFLGGTGSNATMPERIVFNGPVDFQLHENSVRSERLKVLVFKNGGVNSIWDGAFYTEGTPEAPNLTVYVDGQEHENPSIYDESFPANQEVRVYLNLPIPREEANQTYWLKRAQNIVDMAYAKDEAPTDLYVDGSVSDGSIQTGTIGAPFKTMEQAKEAADADYDNATRFRQYFTDAGYDPSDLAFTDGSHRVTEFTLHLVGGTEEADNTFAGDPRLAGIEIKVDGDIAIDAEAFRGCENLKTLDIEKAGNLTAGESAFSGCTALEELNIEDTGDLEIGKRCFADCAGLEEITITSAEDVTIGESAFDNCYGIKEAAIEQADDVTIGAYAFLGTNVSSVTIRANGDVTLTENALRHINSLKSLVIEDRNGGSNITIGAGAVAECRNMEEVLLLNSNPPAISTGAFANSPVGLLRIDGGASAVEAGAFDNSKTLGTYIDGSKSFTEPLADRIGQFRNIVLTSAESISADAQVFGGNPSLERVYLSENTDREHTGGEIFAGMPEDAAAYVALNRTDFTDGNRPVRTDGALRFLDDVSFLFIDGTNTNDHPDGSEDNGFRTFEEAKTYAGTLGPAGGGSGDYYYTDLAEVLRDAFDRSGIQYSEKNIRFPVPLADTDACTFYVKGTVTVKEDETWDSGDGKTITLLRYDDFTGAFVSLDGGTLTLGKVVLDGNAVEAGKPLIESTKTDTTIVIHDGAWLRNNDNTATGAWDGSEYTGGGAIRTLGNIDMDGGKITDNKAVYGGGVHVSLGTFNLSGGTIENNTAYIHHSSQNLNYSAGGGVLLTRGATMNMSGGTVRGNTAENGSGAGISAGALFAANGSNESTFNMTGGSISGNTSTTEGGGLYIQMGSKAYISKGSITGNTSLRGAMSPSYGGGGIYVNGSHGLFHFPDGELHLTNVLVTDNQADIAGGGIAGRGTSTTRIYLRDGSAIYDNPAGGINADLNIDYVSYAAPYGWADACSEGIVSPYMFNGTPYNWINAETGETVPEAELGMIEKRTIHLRANPGEGAPTSGDVIISGNRSGTRGGGIGSNGTIIVGREPNPTTLTVTPEAGKILTGRDMKKGETFTFSTYVEKYHDFIKITYAKETVYYYQYDPEEPIGSGAVVTGTLKDRRKDITGLPSYSFDAEEEDLGKIITLLVVEDTTSDSETWADEDTYLEFRYVVGLGKDGDLTANLKQVSRGRYRRNADGTPDFNADVTVFTWMKETYVHRNTTPVTPANAVFNNHARYRDLSADKTWLNADGSTTPPPNARVVFELYADGRPTGKTVELDGRTDSNGETAAWTATWKNQEVYRLGEDGKPYKQKESDTDFVRIEYSVREVSVTLPDPGYDGYGTPALTTPAAFDRDGKAVIQNRQEQITITGEKAWDLKGADESLLPESITVYVKDNNKTVETITVKPGADKTWKYTSKKLPKYRDDGKTEIRYTVDEAVPAGFTRVVTGYNIHNTLETTKVSVRKIWDDNENASGKRPVRVVARLNNGMSVVLTRTNGWTATIDNLPRYDKDGKEIEYTWTEQEVIGYTLTDRKTTGTMTVFTNSLWRRPDNPPPGKPPKVPEPPFVDILEYDTPLGVEVLINHVGDCFD